MALPSHSMAGRVQVGLVQPVSLPEPRAYPRRYQPRLSLQHALGLGWRPRNPRTIIGARSPTTLPARPRFTPTERPLTPQRSFHRKERSFLAPRYACTGLPAQKVPSVANKPRRAGVSGSRSACGVCGGALLLMAPSDSPLPGFSGQCQLLLVAIEMRQLMVFKSSFMD